MNPIMLSIFFLKSLLYKNDDCNYQSKIIIIKIRGRREISNDKLQSTNCHTKFVKKKNKPSKLFKISNFAIQSAK